MSFFEEFVDTFASILDNGVAFILGALADLFSYVFGRAVSLFTDWANRSHDVIVGTGSTVINSLFGSAHFRSTVFTSDFLFFFVGLLASVLVLRFIIHLLGILINIIRG